MDSFDKRKYNNLRIEDFIWFLYFFILIANLYSNHLEEDNLTNTKKTDTKKIRSINLVVLTIVFLIYIYFLIRSYQDYLIAKEKNEPLREKLNRLSVIASMLFVIGGFIFIYIEYKNDDETLVGII